MTRIIKAMALRNRDLFALPNGREHAAARQHKHARRPWWKKLFG